MRNRTHQVATAAAALLIGAAAPSIASAAVTFGKAALRAYADPFGSIPPQTADYAATSLPAGPHALDVHAEAPNEGQGTAKGAVTFFDPARGTVDLETVSASGHYGYSPNYPGGSGASVGLIFDYIFTVDASYLAKISYDLTYAGNGANEVGAGYRLYNAANTIIASDYFNQTGAGASYSSAFGPGTYRLQIEGSGYLGANEFKVSKSGAVSGGLGFDLLRNDREPVSPAPEPATWAMMLTGFGAMGRALRRRHLHDRLRAGA